MKEWACSPLSVPLWLPHLLQKPLRHGHTPQGFMGTPDVRIFKSLFALTFCGSFCFLPCKNQKGWIQLFPNTSGCLCFNTTVEDA